MIYGSFLYPYPNHITSVAIFVQGITSAFAAELPCAPLAALMSFRFPLSQSPLPPPSAAPFRGTPVGADGVVIGQREAEISVLEAVVLGGAGEGLVLLIPAVSGEIEVIDVPSLSDSPAVCRFVRTIRSTFALEGPAECAMIQFGCDPNLMDALRLYGARRNADESETADSSRITMLSQLAARLAPAATASTATRPRGESGAARTLSGQGPRQALCAQLATAMGGNALPTGGGGKSKNGSRSSSTSSSESDEGSELRATPATASMTPGGPAPSRKRTKGKRRRAAHSASPIPNIADVVQARSASPDRGGARPTLRTRMLQQAQQQRLDSLQAGGPRHKEKKKESHQDDDDDNNESETSGSSGARGKPKGLKAFNGDSGHLGEPRRRRRSAATRRRDLCRAVAHNARASATAQSSSSTVVEPKETVAGTPAEMSEAAGLRRATKDLQAKK